MDKSENSGTETIRQFGRAARPLWSLSGTGVFLNHGSFGACPIAVQREQARLLREYAEQPEAFFRDRVMPGEHETPLRKAAEEVARFVGARATNLAFVENATTGVQTILESVPLRWNDQILITDHQYRAVRLAVEKRCRETGAEPVIVSLPVPLDAATVVSRISDRAGPKVKLAIIDHITSSTACVFPIREIVAELHRKNIPVLVDGAHAIGQVPLELEALGAEWYVSNAHKWLFAPPGSAFLHARADQVENTRCLITSHFADLGFPRAFDYVGTRDYINWLTMPAALAFFRNIDLPAFEAHNRYLLLAASDKLIGLGAEPVCDIKTCAYMRSFLLPQRRPVELRDAVDFRDGLWREEKIQVASSVLFNRLVLRVSAQAYVGLEEIEKLAEILARRGWPGR